MAGPSTITNPAIVASQTKTNEHKSFQGRSKGVLIPLLAF